MLSSSDQAVSCPFDHHSDKFAADPVASFAEVRQTGPLVWSDKHGGYWIALSYDLVRRILLDADTFTVAQGPDSTGGIMIPTPKSAAHRPLFVPGEVDGREHDRFRAALAPHFSKRRIDEIGPLIERYVQESLARIKSIGHNFDLIDDFALPMVTGIACEHLGLEADDPPSFFAAMLQWVSSFSEHEPEDADAAALDTRWRHIVDIIAERRRRPTGDVISALVQHESAFTDEEVQMMVLNITLGAADTTASLLAQAVLHLSEHPDLRRHLHENPHLIRRATEEFLRLLIVVVGPARTVTRDVELAGVTLRAGQRVMPGLPAANRDPVRYAAPEKFDLERGASQHLAMGVGTHFCLGAWLAKYIVTAALTRLITAEPPIRIERNDVETAHPMYPINHVLHMRGSFSA